MLRCCYTYFNVSTNHQVTGYDWEWTVEGFQKAGGRCEPVSVEISPLTQELFLKASEYNLGWYRVLNAPIGYAGRGFFVEFVGQQGRGIYEQAA